jgi:plasmid maintenance system antidote protein VapI|tara:strand:- start:265 stop:453 length:189 start_codon:yes stop_codon:yes gene_type:complete
MADALGKDEGEERHNADPALRLARFFGVSAELWLGLQAEYDLRNARQQLGDEIEHRVHPFAA